MPAAVHRFTHSVRRIVQTPRAFSNWPSILSEMSRRRAGGPASLTFVTRKGQQISCPNVPGARVPVYEVFAEGCYSLPWFLGPLLEREIGVVDIGAHVGAFACDLARLNPLAQIRCFEPSAATSAFTRQNVEQNGLGGRVTVDDRAVAAQVGWAEFEDNGAGSALNGLAQDGTPARAGSSTRVETTSFDLAVVGASPVVSVVKIDCEGGEYDLVLGSTPASWDPVERVVLEYHPVAGHSWSELRDWFAERGLAVVRHEPASPGQGTAWLSRAPLTPA
jgi:FkbM family methyltransferase